MPIDEQKRLATLRDLRILDTPGEEAFDNMTRMAARYFDAPIALITLLDDRRQWFKSRIGLPIDETPRQHAFCIHALARTTPLIVSDAAADERFADNPFVTGEPFIRFYAGAPLVTANGSCLGTLCIVDDAPREGFAGDQAATLMDMARIVVRLIENRAQELRQIDRFDFELSVAERSKRQFLALMSHELRTPLNAILGFSELIASDAGSQGSGDKHAVYAQYILESGRHLIERIDTILDWSQVESGTLSLAEEEVDLGDMISMAVGDIVRTRPAAAIRLAIDIPEGLPAVLCDAVHTQRIVYTIVDNALKFSPADTPVRLQARLGEDGVLTVMVADEGPGMTPVEIDRAMTPFSQIDMELARTAEGLGMGLPLSGKIMELQGGGLTLESAPQQGTRVTLSFPIHRVGDA